MERRTLAQLMEDKSAWEMNTKDLKRRGLTAGIRNALEELRVQVDDMTKWLNGERYKGPESIPEDNLVVIRRDLMKAVNLIEQTCHGLTIYSENEINRYNMEGGR